MCLSISGQQSLRYKQPGKAGSSYGVGVFQEFGFCGVHNRVKFVMYHIMCVKQQAGLGIQSALFSSRFAAFDYPVRTIAN